MSKTLETYVDVARRLLPGDIVLIKRENGDNYNGKVDSVRDSGGGRVVVVMAPGTSCWLSEEPGPFDLHPDTFVELPIYPTTRVFPANEE
jgi:hypothetical protein